MTRQRPNALLAKPPGSLHRLSAQSSRYASSLLGRPVRDDDYAGVHTTGNTAIAAAYAMSTWQHSGRRGYPVIITLDVDGLKALPDIDALVKAAEVMSSPTLRQELRDALAGAEDPDEVVEAFADWEGAYTPEQGLQAGEDPSLSVFEIDREPVGAFVEALRDADWSDDRIMRALRDWGESGKVPPEGMTTIVDQRRYLTDFDTDRLVDVRAIQPWWPKLVSEYEGETEDESTVEEIEQAGWRVWTDEDAWNHSVDEGKTKIVHEGRGRQRKREYHGTTSEVAEAAFKIKLPPTPFPVREPESDEVAANPTRVCPECGSEIDARAWHRHAGSKSCADRKKRGEPEKRPFAASAPRKRTSRPLREESPAATALSHAMIAELDAVDRGASDEELSDLRRRRESLVGRHSPRVIQAGERLPTDGSYYILAVPFTKAEWQRFQTIRQQEARGFPRLSEDERLVLSRMRDRLRALGLDEALPVNVEFAAEERVESNAPKAPVPSRYRYLPADDGRESPIRQWGASHSWRLGSYWTVPVDVPLADLRGVSASAASRDRLESVATARKAGAPLPPIEIAVFRDGSAWVVDGNHRLVDARRAGLATVNVIFTFVGQEHPAVEPNRAGPTIDNERGWGHTPNNENVDHLGKRVWMKPSVFHRLAQPLARSEARSVEAMKKHITGGGGIAAPVLYLYLPNAWERGDFAQPAVVEGHEGRNRMYASSELYGDEPVEVHLLAQPPWRARHLTAEVVDAMNRALVPEKQAQLHEKHRSALPGPFFATVAQNAKKEPASPWTKIPGAVETGANEYAWLPSPEHLGQLFDTTIASVLGCASWGCAFKTAAGTVIKASWDKDERHFVDAVLALRARGRQLPGIVSIERVTDIGEAMPGYPAFAYERDYVEPIEDPDNEGGLGEPLSTFTHVTRALDKIWALSPDQRSFLSQREWDKAGAAVRKALDKIDPKYRRIVDSARELLDAGFLVYDFGESNIGHVGYEGAPLALFDAQVIARLTPR